jgi:uncharacterized YigZ family protein
MTRKPYQIAVSEVIDETIVTRSRFICYISPCNSAEQAKTQITSLRELHPQASHHCYAFLTGAPDNSQGYGFSDDGEPTGTAGKPMLAVLQGSNVGELCAVVVRYFGGTKLGTGGLQRAYGASVRQALLLLQTSVKIPMVYKSLACQYNQTNDVVYVIEQLGGKIIAQQFSEQVYFSLAIPDQQETILQQQLLTLSAGQIILKKN